MADDGTHAAGGVAASEWLAANLGCGVVDTGGTGAHISAQDDAQIDDDREDEVSVFDVILGPHVSQREDTVCDEDGVDISVGVNDDAVVGVGVHGQGVNPGVRLGVDIVFRNKTNIHESKRKDSSTWSFQQSYYTIS